MNLNRYLSALLLLWLGAAAARGNTFYFIATSDAHGNINYDFFSPNNWYVPNGNNGWTPAGGIPTANDNAIVLTSANAAANSVVLLGLFLEPSVHVTGGNFAVGTLGTAGGTSFTASTVEIRNFGYITNDLTSTSNTITLDSGAFLLLQTGSSVLSMDTTVLYNVGQIVLSSGSVLSFVGGSNQLWIRPSAVISGSGSTSLTVSGSAHLDFYHDGTLRSDLGLMSVSTPNTTWFCTQGLAKFRTAASTAVLELHGPMAVPANATNQVVGPGLTRFYGDASPSTVSGVLQIGAVDPSTQLLDPGTLEMDRLLNGTGLVYTVSTAGNPSTLLWGNGTISVPTLNIDPYGQLVLSNAYAKVLSATTLNQAGLALWYTDHGDLHLNNGAVFNNSGTFEARNSAAFYGGVGALGTFNNTGTFRKAAGTGDTFVAQDNPPAPGATFNNTGLVAAQTGRILLMAGTNRGQFSMEPGTQIRVSGFTNYQEAGASFVGPGTLAVGGATAAVLWLDTNCTIPNLDLESASALDGPGNLNVSQSMLLVSAAVRGAGTLNLLPGASFNATNAQSSNLTRDVSNAGSAVTGSTLMATRPLTWSNAPSGTLAFFGPNGGLDVNYTGPMPTLLNYGTLLNLATNSPLVNWNTTNAGLVLVNPFGLHFNQDFNQVAGSTVVGAGSLLQFSRAARILGGRLSGVGTVQGNVLNAGTVHPGSSPGILTFSGNFTNTSAGTLAVDIGGTSAGPGYSRLANTFGQFSLDGTLQVNWVNGFLPAPGNVFTIVAATNGTRLGQFSAVSGVHANNGLVLVPVYGSTNVSLVVATEPTLSKVSRTGNTAAFTYPSTAGLTNVVEYTDSLAPVLWKTLTTITGDGSVKSVQDSTATNATRFYRVRFL